MSYFHYVKSVQIRSFFWSVFSRIRTEYGEMRSISPYSVWMRENTDQKKLRIWTLFTQCLTAINHGKINFISNWKPTIYCQSFLLLYDTLSKTVTLYTLIINMSVTCFCFSKSLEKICFRTNLKTRYLFYTFLNLQYDFFWVDIPDSKKELSGTHQACMDTLSPFS